MNLRGVTCLVLLALQPTSSYAGLLSARQPDAVSEPPAATSTESLGFEADAVRRTAFDLFARAQRAYASGAYGEAAELFEQAHALDPHPNTLFNLGLALRAAELFGQAWRVFHRLSLDHPNSEDRKVARKVADELKHELAVLSVRATDTYEVCLDGRAFERTREPTMFIRAVEPGAHRLQYGVDETSLDLELGVEAFVDLDELMRADHKRARTMVTVGLGVGVGSGVLGTGLAIIGLSPKIGERSRRGLAAASISAWGIALTAASLALVAHRRQTGEAQVPKRRQPKLVCADAAKESRFSKSPAAASSRKSAPAPTTAREDETPSKPHTEGSVTGRDSESDGGPLRLELAPPH